MDFAPAFAVAVWTLLQLAARSARAKLASAPAAILALCTLWWTYQVTTARIFLETGRGVAAKPPNFTDRPADLLRLESHAYYPDTDFDSYGL